MSARDFDHLDQALVRALARAAYAVASEKNRHAPTPTGEEHPSFGHALGGGCYVQPARRPCE